MSKTSKLWIVPPFVVLAAVFFYPLTLIAIEAFHLDQGAGGYGLANFARVLGSVLFQNALIHTIVIALMATAGCLLLGFVLAVILAFVPFTGSATVARLIETYLALPSFLLTLAFTFIYGSAGILNGIAVKHWGMDEPPVHFLYSMAGVVLAEVTAFTPFVLRPLLAAFSQFESGQIEVAASLGAKPWRIVRSIIFPAALPALLVGGSLCLLLTVNEFGIVLFIGAKGVITLPMLIYGKSIQEGDYVSACTIALINIVISLGLYSLYNRVVNGLGKEHAGLV